jgi:hypothetical protein
MSKLRVVNDGLAACHKLVAESGDGGPVQPFEQTVKQKITAQQEVAGEPKKPTVRFMRKGEKK